MFIRIETAALVVAWLIIGSNTKGHHDENSKLDP
jgi:hypothetical protein